MWPSENLLIVVLLLTFQKGKMFFWKFLPKQRGEEFPVSINTKLFIGTTQHSLRFLKCACKNGVYVLWHFRAMVRHEKTPFFQCGYHLRRKYAGVQRDAIPWLWVSNRGEKHPCWHTILLAKSSVIPLATADAGKGLSHARQTLFGGSRTDGFCGL